MAFKLNFFLIQKILTSLEFPIIIIREILPIFQLSYLRRYFCNRTYHKFHLKHWFVACTNTYFLNFLVLKTACIAFIRSFMYKALVTLTFKHGKKQRKPTVLFQTVSNSSTGEAWGRWLSKTFFVSLLRPEQLLPTKTFTILKALIPFVTYMCCRSSIVRKQCHYQWTTNNRTITWNWDINTIHEWYPGGDLFVHRFFNLVIVSIIKRFARQLLIVNVQFT